MAVVDDVLAGLRRESADSGTVERIVSYRVESRQTDKQTNIDINAAEKPTHHAIRPIVGLSAGVIISSRLLLAKVR